LTTILHTGLNENFIEKIELTEFAKAFDGGSPERPLGIRWIDKPRSNATVNKVTLLYLFKKLSEAGLIDSWPGTEILQRKLEYVFTDGKGNKLQNWAQSVKNIQVSKTVTHRKKEIDTLVRRMAGNNGVLS